MNRACSMQEMRNSYKILVENHKGHRPLGRLAWEDTIKTDLKN